MSDIIHTSGSTEESIILFEMSSQGSLRTGGFNSMELATRSAQGLSQAMGAIQTLANRTAETINQLPQKPSECELEFGIKIDAEAGAVVSKASGEGNLRVKLIWRSSSP
jgi:hypothetical protein